MGFTRRDFLGLVGGAAAGYGLTKVPYRRLVRLDDNVLHESVPAIESWVRTTCQICPGACGMEVRIVDGRPMAVRGNRLNPISRGGLCPVGVEAMHHLYSPDRLKAPVQRVSARGEDAAWKQVPWDEALDAIAARIQELRTAGRGDQICLVDGYDRGLLSALSRWFLKEVGSHGYFVDRAATPMPAAMALSQGINQAPAYDLENARTILSFGAPLLEGWESPVQGQRGVGAVRRARTEGEHRSLLHLDVRRSKTANRADRFLQVAPGAFGATALAIAYVLISQELYDVAFIDQHVFGFEDWTDDAGNEHRGFKSFVLSSCRPQDLEGVTGVGARDILEIAKRFAEQRPSVAVGGGEALAHSNGLSSAYAIQALNALVGAIDQPGGVLLAEPVPLTGLGAAESASDPAAPSAATPYGVRDCEELLRQVADGQPKPAIIFLVHSNPFFSKPGAERFKEVIGDDTIVVSFTPLSDCSIRWADYVLPDHTFLERWQDAVGPRTFPNAMFAITRPVVDPLYDTRHTGDVLLDLARRVGIDTPHGSSFDAVLRSSASEIFDAQRGSVFTTEREADEIREMERRGWWVPSHASFASFWDEMLSTGGWWDPAYPYGLWGRVLRTPSHRFEFSSQDLQQRVHGGSGSPEAVAKVLGLPSAGDASFRPRLEEPEWFGESGERTFALHMVRPIVPNTAIAAALPWVRELMNTRVAWETWAEINATQARELGVADGDLVRLVAGERAIRARALLSEGVPAGLVVVPYGLGRESGGRWASMRGTNPLALVAPVREKLSGSLVLQSTRVRIEIIDGGGSHA